MRATLATIVSVACFVACNGEPPKPATSPPVSVAQLQFPPGLASVKEFPEIKGYMIDVGGGNWCVGGPDEYYLTNNAESCLSLKGDTIRDVVVADQQFRLATMSWRFHTPHALAPNGASVAIADGDMRVDCAEAAALFVTVQMFDANGDLVLTEALDPPRPMPASDISGPLVKFICR